MASTFLLRAQEKGTRQRAKQVLKRNVPPVKGEMDLKLKLKSRLDETFKNYQLNSTHCGTMMSS